jgi:hypothetical protein
MPILLHHHQLLIGSERNDVHPVDGLEHEEFVVFARARRDFEIGSNPEDSEITDSPGTDFFPRPDHLRFMIYDRRADEDVAL